MASAGCACIQRYGTVACVGDGAIQINVITRGDEDGAARGAECRCRGRTGRVGGDGAGRCAYRECVRIECATRAQVDVTALCIHVTESRGIGDGCSHVTRTGSVENARTGFAFAR
ncbi:MAG: hypothetical protein EBX50_18110, partial [Chitinophagia bacterium]|nr:hypothetical protein [Chitinophagia bacterium]